MGFEDTEDEGGGRNIGYTDAGDYADYLVYNKEFTAYQVDFRIAAQDNEGKIGLYLLDDSGSREFELLQIETPKTGGWQTWTTVSVNSKPLVQGVRTIRMRVLKEH